MNVSEFRKGCWDTTYPSSLTTQHLGSSNKGLVGSAGGGNGTSGVGGLNTNSVSSGKCSKSVHYPLVIKKLSN